MARKLRVEYEGAIYHVMSRGDRQEEIFLDDDDRHRFLATLQEVCERTGWMLHAYVLMGNHYHWLLETPRANLVAGMQWLQSTYTIRFNRRHRLAGHLFQGRYKAVLVEPDSEEYFVALSDYIHLNPARAGLIAGGSQLSTYRWSSLAHFVATPSKRPAWMVVERVLGELGWQDKPSHRRRYMERMEERALERIDPDHAAKIRRGWCLGGGQFRAAILDRMEEIGCRLRTGERQGAERTDEDHSELAARRLVDVGLSILGLSRAGLGALAKGDERKRLIGSIVRRRTVMSLRWIGVELGMGCESRVSRLCSLAGNRRLQARRSKLERRIDQRARGKD